MGKLAFLLAGIIFLATPAALAQTYMTVAEMEQELTALARQREDEAAPQLARFQLTQRLSPSRLFRWESQFKGGLARQILLCISDASSVYDPPASELPSAPAPDQPTKDAILQRARQYVRTMRPRLPNFSAARGTVSYEISTLDQIKAEEYELQFLELTQEKLGFRSLGTVDSSRQLFLEGESEELVTYRDGSEVQSLPETRSKHRRLVPRGLTSAGEFGPILSLVDKDTADGSIAWDHWEQGPSGLLAVYRYSVPADKSHFAIVLPTQSVPGLSYEQHPAYHGEIAVEPATDSVMRIVIEADSPAEGSGSGTTVPAAMVVEYAPVEIGGKDYICPVHAVSINRVIDEGAQNTPGLPRVYINDVTFTRYHLFRSEMRILP